jgi:hypothetical protein
MSAFQAVTTQLYGRGDARHLPHHRQIPPQSQRDELLFLRALSEMLLDIVV